MLRPDMLLFVDYGQACAQGEIQAATQISEALGIPLRQKKANCNEFGGGQLSGKAPINPEAPEFWPFRNQLLLTLAAMEFYGTSRAKVLIGTVKGDAVHPDGTEEFISKFNDLISCQSEITVQAPAISMTAKELIQISGVPLEVIGWAFSCHLSNHPCGQCRGCTKHNETLNTR